MIFLAAVFLFTIGIFAASPASAQVPVQTVTFVPNFIFDIFTKIMLSLTNLALSLMLFVLTFIIEIAGYNGYLSSTAVNVGWVMIRDLTNMIFVVALLMIAFGTILGIEHYEWKHMLFKLVSAAILVNFSRIICGVLIDISQVVMITFVNGIAATVGGNFIRAFNLDNIKSFNSTVNGGQMNSEGVWLAAGASLFISVTILVTMATFLAMLVARVIILWILIVLSPIAFVFGVLHQTEHYAHEWWSEFGKNVITGPVLIFFLWLTLVTVGNGVIHQEISGGSNSPKEMKIDQSTSASFNSGVGQAASWENLVNFIIAIGMLIAGLRITSHLGGIGAEWSEHAMDYGKSMVRMASGVGLAQKAGQKVGKYAQERVEKNMELVGGIVKSKAGKWWNENVTQKRIAAANENLKTAHERDKDGNFVEKSRWKRMGAAASLYMNPFTPDIVREKIAGSAEKAYENSLEQNQHLASASNHPFGRDKLMTERRLHELEATGGEIKREKDAQMDALLHKARAIMADKDLTDAEKVKQLSEGEFRFSGAMIGQTETVSNRWKKANKSEVNAAQLERIHHGELEEEKGKLVEGLQSGFRIPGRKVVATSGGNAQDEMKMDLDRRVAKGEITEKDRKKILEDMRTKPGFEYEINPLKFGGANFADEKVYKEAKDKKRQELDAEVLAGRMTRKTADSELAGFDKVTFWAEKIEKEVDSRVAAGFITKEDGEKIKKDAPARIQHQFQEFEAAELAKKNEQYSKREGTYKKREEAEAEKHLWEHNKGYQQREKHINEMSHDMQQIQAQTATSKELSLLEQIRNLLEKGSEEKRAVDLAALTGKKDFAKLENEQRSLEIRAQAAEKAGNPVFANTLKQQADSLIFAKTQEGIKGANLNADERANLAAFLSRELVGARSKTFGTDEEGKKEKAANDQQIASLVKQQLALAAINGGGSAYEAQEAMRRGLGANGLKWDEEWSEATAKRRMYSLILGRKVGDGDKEEEEAEKELTQIFGSEEKKTAAFRQLGLASKNQTGQGNTDYIIMQQKEGKGGRTEWSIRPERGEALANAIQGTVYGWDQQGEIEKPKIKQALFGKRSSDGTTLLDVNAEQAQRNASLYKNLTQQTIKNQKTGMLGDINTSKLYQSKKAVVDQLQAFADAVVDDKAFEAVLGKLDTLISEAKKAGTISDAEINDMLNRVKRDKGSGGKKGKGGGAGGGGTPGPGGSGGGAPATAAEPEEEEESTDSDESS